MSVPAALLRLSKLTLVALLSVCMPLSGCSSKVDELPLSSTAARGNALTAANGLSINSLGSNGISINGLNLNGLMLNGLMLNGLMLNGLMLNGLMLNGVSLNGLMLNGLMLNGVSFNGLMLNGLMLNGLMLNGLMLNGLMLNGLMLNSLPASTATDAKTMMRLLTECALPQGQCINMTDVDGTTPLSYCGVAGIDPTWGQSAADLSKTAAMAQCVLDRGQSAGVTYQPVMMANFKKLMKYMVQCALPSGQSVTLQDENNQPWVLSGALGLGPEWATGPLSPTGQ